MGHPMPDGSVRDAYQDATAPNGQLDGSKGDTGPTDLASRVRPTIEDWLSLGRLAE